MRRKYFGHLAKFLFFVFLNRNLIYSAQRMIFGQPGNYPSLMNSEVLYRARKNLPPESDESNPYFCIVSFLVFFLMALQSFVGSWPLFSFLILYKGGRTPWRGDQPVARPLPLNTGQHKHRINTHTYQTSIPWIGFEPMITESVQAKTVHALNRTATVTGPFGVYFNVFYTSSSRTSKWSLSFTISQWMCATN
jgi:hypothetical protein